MLATLYMLALRRSELVEIDYEVRGDSIAVLRITDHGLELELLRSKADQENPAIVAADRHHNPRIRNPGALDCPCRDPRSFAALTLGEASAGASPPME